jgi:adenine phosphoribosyltransferase
LTAYYWKRVDEQPNYRQENYLKLVHDNAGVDVLLITGMREEGAVAAVAHLVPGSRVFEVRVQTNDEETRRLRGGNAVSTRHVTQNSGVSLIFDNDAAGEEAATSFLKLRLVPLFDEDLPRLAKMVPTVADFPRRGVTFRDVLKIAQQQGGLKLCTSLMQRLYDVDWASIDAVICCETGGYVFASALAFSVDNPLILIRKAGKIPPPTILGEKIKSHISSVLSDGSLRAERIEVDRTLISKARSVVFIDDVLATGHMLCAVLRMLTEAGIHDDDIGVLVVAEFPAHRGRERLCQSGLGRAQVKSLLVFEGT